MCGMARRPCPPIRQHRPFGTGEDRNAGSVMLSVARFPCSTGPSGPVRLATQVRRADQDATACRQHRPFGTGEDRTGRPRGRAVKRRALRHVRWPLSYAAVVS